MHLRAFYLLLMAIMVRSAIVAQEVIDVHTHLITPDFLSVLDSEHRQMEEGFPLPSYDAASHLRWMDEAGIQTSVLTLAAPHPASPLAIRRANEAAAQLKREHPGRFLFYAALPLPNVEAALREARYALDTLKADGIKLATNAEGQYLGAPELDTLFSLLCQRGAVVILHPHRPTPVNPAVMQQTPLAMQEYLSETTRAVANMITRNVLARYKGVKVVVPHCGAYLPLAIPRMKSLAPVMQKNGMVGPIDWQANLDALYYDLAGAHSPEVIRTLLQITTPDHLLYGSDYPYVAPHLLTASLNRMRQYLTDEPDLSPFRKMILRQNAEWLLSLTDQKSHATPTDATPMVRIAEIEVFPEQLEDYLTYANQVDRLSMEREPGVICLFPMQSADNPTQIRIVEIYASATAYQQHLKTEHFQHYKQGTAKMVKRLILHDMKPLDGDLLKSIFAKSR